MAAIKVQDWWTEDDREKGHELMENTELQDLSLHINERNRAAQMAQRSSQVLFQTLFFEGKEPDDPRCIVDAVVFSIRANGFLVYVPRYALKGAVYMQEDGDEGSQVRKLSNAFVAYAFLSSLLRYDRSCSTRRTTVPCGSRAASARR